ncbi:MAG: hypothetical protein CO137_00070 [Candidatus Magasanikbacteria bacterium CG_4_9_14_3_um_filter_32_9]|uniref:Reverse transcriptase domain-containing protein n=1 Tax=Candidatus Magasanikbacteria bacterium CG_4_9_14_3_um_filter_32_9 TaxID=1974644 RepID=A0A2M7Z7V4_9BACT|nr:MAG: hypothetical protein CO137_00070 [Candidatus Magasanikbacteria bacterium CG_4_9_14_3_um_filter_32_9]
MIHKNDVKNKKILFDEITSLEGLFSAWEGFKRGKEGRLDVQKFFLNLERNIFNLYEKVKSGTYQHSAYTSFLVCDPKLRNINKAEVVDRVMHHSIVKHIEPLFEKSFIFDSYSSRIGKGTHRGVERLKSFCLKLTKNKTRTAWALKCDIRKFFDSVDHDILISILRDKIRDEKLMEIIEKIIRSYSTKPGKGIPLGNLTSQIFSNIYLDRLDQFMKRNLRIKHYLRYTDDFIILDVKKERLEKLVPVLNDFLEQDLKLQLHPNKLIIRKIHRGIDFLGYIVYPTHLILRTKTKRRMLRKIAAKKRELDVGIISAETFDNTLQSYLGMLTHCRGEGIRNEVNRITDDWGYLNFIVEA